MHLRLRHRLVITFLRLFLYFDGDSNDFLWLLLLGLRSPLVQPCSAPGWSPSSFGSDLTFTTAAVFSLGSSSLDFIVNSYSQPADLVDFHQQVVPSSL